MHGASSKRAAGRFSPALAVASALLALAIFAVRAWAASGDLDHSFSGDGRQTTAFANANHADRANAVAIQSDGKLVLAGLSVQAATGNDFALARYNPNGSLDHSFSGDGRKITAFANGTGGDDATAVAIQANGRIVVGGHSNQLPEKFALARYNPNGSLDHSFSGDGRKITAFANSTGGDAAEAVVIQANGKIVVAGYSNRGGSPHTGRDFALARYNPNGSLDHSFSGDGRKTTAFGTDAYGTGDDNAEAVAIQANGRIVAAGYSNQGDASGNDFALARYNPNGSLDTSFSGDGRQITAFANGTGKDYAYGVAIQANGRIVVAGVSNQGGSTGRDFALARYNRNGTLDTSFSGDGRQTTAFANGTGKDAAYGVAIQANGGIVAAGYSNQGGASGNDFALARYNPNGTLDTSFSGDGRQTTAFANSTRGDAASGVAIQANGRIVAAGASNQGGSTGHDFAVARYLPGASFAAQRIGSKVTLMIHGCGFYQCHAFTDGTVSSHKHACEAHRTVLVRPVGGDELYRGSTGSDGTWRVDQVPPGGDYEAVAARKMLPHERVCKRATSPSVQYFPPP